MDEFNRNFDPTDEYMSLEDTNSTPAVEDENIVQEVQEPVEAETVEDDVFEAFEKAENTPSPYPNPIPQPTSVQPAPPVQPQNYYYQAPPVVEYRTPNVPPVQNAPLHTPPQYMPRREQAPQYQPTVAYNAPMYTRQPNYAPVQQYNQPQSAPQHAVPQQPAPQQQYNPYQQNVNNIPQQPYNPYGNAPAVKKEKTPKKTKVLIGILIALLVVFGIGFTLCCISIIGGDSFGNDLESNNPLAQYATEPEEYNFDEFFSDDFSGGFNFMPQYSGEEFDEKITLQADEGQTQLGDDDQSTYAPDEKAQGIKLDKLPKDKDNKKYTTQSAYNAVTDAVVSILCYKDEITDNPEDIIGEGTGTVISSDGYIVTNSHVIGDSKAYTINVVLNNSKEYKAKVVGFDSRTDLAVLKIDAKDLKFAKFSDSSYVEVGQDVVAIGNPGGQSFQNSLTKGIVSAVDRELDLNSNVNYIQIDAAINPGNSGGPLCNLYGQVVGINTAKIAAEEYEGMGFAIPSNTVAQIANDLIHYGYVKDRVMLGLVGMQVNDDMTYNYNVPYGILITSISEGGPLDNTDIKEYDILTAINDVEVTSFQEVYKELAKYKPGDKVNLTLYRLEE